MAGRVNGEPCGVIALRFGASLALDHAVRHPHAIERLVLLEPVLDGSAYVEHLRRRQRIKDQMTGLSAPERGNDGYCNFEGYKTSLVFVRQLCGFSLNGLTATGHRLGDIVLVHIGDHPGSSAAMEALTMGLRSVSRSANVRNVRFPRFWERIRVQDFHPLLDTVLGLCRA